MLQNSISPFCAPNLSCTVKQSTYHGSCKGVERFVPIVSSAVPISPLNISTHILPEGRRQLTRPPRRPILHKALSCFIWRNSYVSVSALTLIPPRKEMPTATIVPKLVKSHSPRHFRSHESRMHNTNDHTLFLQIQTQQFAHHIQCCLGSMMCVVSSALFLVS
jgi:hypothetical protein